MAQWFYGKEGAQHGPLDEATLRARFQSGELGKDVLIWKEGMGSWLPVDQVPEFSMAEPAADDSVYATPTTNPVNSAPAYVPPPTSGLAIASLVCGILAIVSCYVNGLFGIPAVICGHMGMKQFRDPQKPISGKGMAIAGLICGYIGIAIQICFIAFFAAIFSGAGIFEQAIEKAQEDMERELEKAKEREEQYIENEPVEGE